jgi:protein ImuB
MPDHPPSVVRWRGTERHIVAGFGPERIAAEWWRGTLAPARAVDGSQGNDARDYYRVQDSTGLWTWVFRQTATSRWYIHGYWA